MIAFFLNQNIKKFKIEGKMNMDLKCKTRKIRDQDEIKLLGDQVIKKGK
jgi:hypothetical protein